MGTVSKRCVRSHEFAAFAATTAAAAAANFLARIGANKCYRNEINPAVYAAAHAGNDASPRDARRESSLLTLAKLESMPRGGGGGREERGTPRIRGNTIRENGNC